MSLPRLYRCGVDRPVVNKTGITGKFDFHLEYGATSPGIHHDGADATGPPVAAALQQQLGLRLEPASGPCDLLVVDHVERPIGN